MDMKIHNILLLIENRKIMRNFALALSVMFLLLGCSKNEDTIDCESIIISYEYYKNSKSDAFDFADIKLLSNGCLKISINYGGGCGKISAMLVDSGDIFESKPAQRKLRLLFIDNDECESLKRTDFYFSIDNLKIDFDNEVALNFENTDLTILYKY